jgi:peptidoglycan hydrolase-like protein with peptidoglycan-binding domain
MSGISGVGGTSWPQPLDDGDVPAASMPVVKQGDRGEAVRTLQEKLNDARDAIGLPPIGVDGDFGPGTAGAIRDFQKLWGLTADAHVGPMTWRRLLGEANPARSTPRAGSPEAKVMAHRAAIESASRKWGIPAPIICGIIQQESGGRADVVGIAGDKGLMQINPSAHPRFFATHDWRNARENAEYGTSVFRDGLKAFDGDVEKAIAAYNAGVGGVRNGLRQGKTLEQITYVPSYVPNVIKYAKNYEDFF